MNKWLKLALFAFIGILVSSFALGAMTYINGSNMNMGNTNSPNMAMGTMGSQTIPNGMGNGNMGSQTTPNGMGNGNMGSQTIPNGYEYMGPPWQKGVNPMQNWRFFGISPMRNWGGFRLTNQIPNMNMGQSQVSNMNMGTDQMNNMNVGQGQMNNMNMGQIQNGMNMPLNQMPMNGTGTNMQGNTGMSSGMHM